LDGGGDKMKKISNHIRSKKSTILFPIALYLQLLLLSTGCVSYKPVELKENEIIKKGVVAKIDSIEVSFIWLADRQVAMNYVGIDPQKSNMLPTFIKISNCGNKVIKVDLARSHLVTELGEELRSLSVEESIDRAKRSDAAVVAWTLGLATISYVAAGGAMIVAGNATTSVNRTLEEDYHNKYFKPTLINAGGCAQGIVFFGFPAKKQTKIILAVIQIKNIDTNEEKKVYINLNEDISK
jgi:hypothetical protein